MKNFLPNPPKFSLMFIALMFSISIAHGQTLLPDDTNTSTKKTKKEIKPNEKITCPYTNQQRYKIDYEIKDVTTPTAAQIDAIDLLKIENHRKDDRMVEVVDTNTGQTIILYSIVEAMKRESESKIIIDFITKLYFVEQ